MEEVRRSLVGEFPEELVERLLGVYAEMRDSFALGKFRPTELEAGRFCEVVLRMLEFKATSGQQYTPLDVALPSLDSMLRSFENLKSATYHDSIRLHIPRVIRSIYDVRNRRDVGHISGDVNPNIADATLVMMNANWILGELIRLYYSCTATEAQVIVDGLAERKLPLVQEFGTFLKTLDPGLSIRSRILILLYVRGEKGASRSELGTWLKGRSSGSVSSELAKLEKEDLIHRGESCWLTRRGIHVVEKIILDRMEDRRRRR